MNKISPLALSCLMLFACDMEETDVSLPSGNADSVLEVDSSQVQIITHGKLIEMKSGDEVSVYPPILALKDANDEVERLTVATHRVLVHIAPGAPIKMEVESDLLSKQTEFAFRLSYYSGDTNYEIQPNPNNRDFRYTSISYDPSTGIVSGHSEKATGALTEKFPAFDFYESNIQTEKNLSYLILDVIPTSNPFEWDCDGHEAHVRATRL